MRVVAEQMRSNPIHGGRVVSGKNQSHWQRLRAKRSVALPGYYRIYEMNHPALKTVAQTSIRTPVQQNAIEIQSGSPDGVVSRPGAFNSQTISPQRRNAIEIRGKFAPQSSGSE